jgi:hypothetical protein|tara:strand:+ start:400 stop:1314 length:915 start_codon:yes stop_codon:yes gene_type:complete
MALTKNILPRHLLLLGFTIFVGPSHAEETDIEWFKDGDISLGHNDNISQALFDRDKIADNFIEVNFSLVANMDLTDFDAIALKGFIEHRQHEVIEDLSRSTYGLQFIYRWQYTLGYFQPFFQFNTSIQQDKYGTEQRDSTGVKSQFFMTNRLTDAIILVSGLEYWQQDAEDNVFDLYHQRIFVSLDYNTKSDATYYGAYSFSKGEIWSSGQAVFCNGADTNDIFPIIAASIEMSPDNVFSNALCSDDWLAYKVKADTHTLKLGYNTALWDSSALDISVSKILSKAVWNLDYESLLYNISYLVRF